MEKDKKFEELKDMCDNWFVNVFVRPYSGANEECRFCGAIKLRNGNVDHSYVDCPVIKYQEILEN